MRAKHFEERISCFTLFFACIDTIALRLAETATEGATVSPAKAVCISLYTDRVQAASARLRDAGVLTFQDVGGIEVADFGFRPMR